jgi:hypothetical protein
MVESHPASEILLNDCDVLVVFGMYVLLSWIYSWSTDYVAWTPSVHCLLPVSSLVNGSIFLFLGLLWTSTKPNDLVLEKTDVPTNLDGGLKSSQS